MWKIVIFHKNESQQYRANTIRWSEISARRRRAHVYCKCYCCNINRKCIIIVIIAKLWFAARVSRSIGEHFEQHQGTLTFRTVKDVLFSVSTNSSKRLLMNWNRIILCFFCASANFLAFNFLHLLCGHLLRHCHCQLLSFIFSLELMDFTILATT